MTTVLDDNGLPPTEKSNNSFLLENEGDSILLDMFVLEIYFAQLETVVISFLITVSV